MSLVAGPVPHLSITERWRILGFAESDPSGEAKALGAAGLAALASLPFLMLSSVVVAAPLAAPAGIALLYVGAWRAARLGSAAMSRALHALTLAGLLAWSALVVIMAAPLDGSEITAALVAPLFAAAPAVARVLLGPRESPAASPGKAGSEPLERARERVALLDNLAPHDAVVIVDLAGTILAATRQARRGFAILPDAFEQPLATLFVDAGDLQRESIAAASEGRNVVRYIDVTPPNGGAAARHVVTFTACGADAVLVRIGARQEAVTPGAGEPGVEAPKQKAGPFSAPGFPLCDMDECLRFALRLAVGPARARCVNLCVEAERGAVAGCDVQSGRRLALLLVECALHRSRPGEAVSVSAATRPGIVLMRAIAVAAGDDRPENDDVVTLRSLAETAGGTLMTERAGGRITFSLRLPGACASATTGDEAHACAA